MLTCSGCGEALSLDTWLQHALLLRYGHPCVPKRHPSAVLLQIVPNATGCHAVTCLCCAFGTCDCDRWPPGERCDCQPCLVTLALAERVGA